MVKIFLDANITIDLVEKRGSITAEELDKHKLFVSPLSFHILMYVTKQKIPYITLSNMVNHFHLVPFNENITYKSLDGPMDDFENNVQLHSAAEAECDFFLTNDTKLLKMKFFGKVQIFARIE